MFADDDYAMLFIFYFFSRTRRSSWLLTADEPGNWYPYRIRLHVCLVHECWRACVRALAPAPQPNGGVTQIHVSFMKWCEKNGFYLHFAFLPQSICVRCSFSFFVWSFVHQHHRAPAKHETNAFNCILKLKEKSKLMMMKSSTIFGMRRVYYHIERYRYRAMRRKNGNNLAERYALIQVCYRSHR